MCPVIFEIWGKNENQDFTDIQAQTYTHTMNAFYKTKQHDLNKSALNFVRLEIQALDWSVFTMFSVRWRSGLKLQFFLFHLYPLLPSHITKNSFMVFFKSPTLAEQSDFLNCSTQIISKIHICFQYFWLSSGWKTLWCLTGSCCQYRVHSSIFTLKTVTDLKALKTMFVYRVLTISDWDTN